MNTIYPGLLNDSLEFFRIDDKIKFFKNGKISNLSDISFTDVEIINEAIDSDLKVKQALVELHPSSGVARLEQFVSCRFGGLDFKADIKDGILQDGEYWPCPKRGNCPHEGVLCKLPIINGNRLEEIEVKLIQLSTTDKKNEVIASILNLSMGTFHALKNILHKKLGVQTKQELTKIASAWNLIWQ